MGIPPPAFVYPGFAPACPSFAQSHTISSSVATDHCSDGVPCSDLIVINPVRYQHAFHHRLPRQQFSLKYDALSLQHRGFCNLRKHSPGRVSACKGLPLRKKRPAMAVGSCRRQPCSDRSFDLRLARACAGIGDIP